MATPDTTPAWLEAEREYTDAVIGTDTLPRMFESAVERYRDDDAQLYKGGVYDRSLPDELVPPAPDGEFSSLTYVEMREIVRSLAAGFRDLGLAAGDRVGIYADTRMEWAQSDFSIMAAGGVVTTVYTESSPSQVQYLLDDPGASGVVVENRTLLDRVLEVEDDLDLEFVVVIDEFEGLDGREDVVTLGEVYERGRAAFDPTAYEKWLNSRAPDDLASLIYTSGTTGKPKGVRLTHRNFRENVNQVRRRVGPRPDKDPSLPGIDADTTSISFLPLAHVFERTAGHFVMLASGATVGYTESPDTISEDITKIQPTAGASVPRVYERIFDSMREQASDSGLKSRIFEWAVSVARAYGRTDSPGAGLRLKHALAHRLVFSTVIENLGGNVEFMVSGGGSLSKELSELFRGMGVPIYEGYGLTEASPVVTTNPPEDLRPGTLGPPLVDNEIRIDGSQVSEDQFDEAEGEVGELLVRGPNVTDGYWQMPDRTEEAFTDDGYFRTGDIVERTADDYLVYHDRLKELLVLDTGKNVAPGPIEDEFSTRSRVEQVMVMGDNEKFVSALVVPNFSALERWADNRNVDLPEDPEARCQDERVREWIEDDVEFVNRDLEKVERIKQFELVPTEWTPENDLLTPSLKKKRRNIKSEFADQVEAIYGEEAPATAD